jgi:hypothetical protein
MRYEVSRTDCMFDAKINKMFVVVRNLRQKTAIFLVFVYSCVLVTFDEVVLIVFS